MSSYNSLSYLGSGFWALEYRSPQRTNTPLSYGVHYMATHMHAKAFVGSQGGTILYKKCFQITIYFIQKMIVLAQNSDPVARNMENKLCYPIVHYSGKLTCA